MQPFLKPLSFGEILDGAFVLYRRGFGTLLGTALIAGVVGEGAGLLLSGSAFDGSIVHTLAAVVVYAMAWAALTWQLSRLYTGQPVSVNAALEAAAPSLLPLLGAMLIAYVLYGLPVRLAGGVMFRMTARVGFSADPGGMSPLLLLPGLAYLAMMAIALALAFAIAPAVVLERAGPWRAVARSFRLAGDALLRVGALALVIIALNFIVRLGLMRVAGLTDDPADLVGTPARLLLGILQALLLPFMAGAAVLMYYDLRLRTEGLDLQMAMDEPSGAAADAGDADFDADGEFADEIVDEGEVDTGRGGEPAPADAGDEAPPPIGEPRSAPTG